MSRFKEHVASGVVDIIECLVGDFFGLLLIPIAIIFGASVVHHNKKKKQIEEETFL